MNKKPFILGVCGGTASGKVYIPKFAKERSIKYFLIFRTFYSCVWLQSQVCKKIQEELISIITGRLKNISERDTNGNELTSQQLPAVRSLSGEQFTQRVFILQQQSFYKDLDDEASCLANASLYNFDHPGV